MPQNLATFTDSLRPGDVLACWSPDRVGRVISLATLSPFRPAELRYPPSHVAIVIEHDGEPLWVESTTLCAHPCVIGGLHRRGVQAHPAELRIADYLAAGGSVRRFTLAPINRLSQTDSQLLSRIVLRHVMNASRPYDLIGAALSGWPIGRRLQRLFGADLESLFCSELVAALLMRLGRMNHADPALFSPGRLLRLLTRTGVYRPAETITSASE